VKTAGDCGRILENPLCWKVADYDFESRAVPQSGTLFGIPKSFLTRQAGSKSRQGGDLLTPPNLGTDLKLDLRGSSLEVAVRRAL
jgi:hypothetical protein